MARFGRMPCLALVAGAAGFLTLPSVATASFIQYGSRATFDSLQSYVSVGWGSLGPPGTGISTPDFVTAGSVTVGLASSQGELTREDEGHGFAGNFAHGDHLLTDAGSKSDSFILNFGSPVTGFGTQIDPHYITGAFSGEIDVFSTGNVLLYEAAFSGVATKVENNTAPFVGVQSSVADIGYAEFWINQTAPGLPARSGALGIDRLDVLTTVPEPASLTLTMTGFVALGALRRRVRQVRGSNCSASVAQ